MTFIDWFAGIGGFRRGMELAGHRCVGFCEADKYANASYISMHLLTERQREYLSKMDFESRQKEILKDEYKNGEWYSADIRAVDAGRIPRADCWCFGFPCQDISRAGWRTGFEGDRSSLFFRIMRHVRDVEKANKPAILFIENVRNLLAVNGGWDFARVLIEMDKCGYDAEWRVFNSKNFGVPQNRERVFIIGHNRESSTGRYLFDEELYKGVEKANPEICTRALVARYPGNVNGTFIYDGKGYRPLTTRECFRLQGWTDDYFDRAQFVNSDRQLYKQAGNGVTVTVIQAIAEKLKRSEEDAGI